MKKLKNKGVLGRRVKLQPDVVESMLGDNQVIQIGTVLDAGPDANCKKGDRVIYGSWGHDKVTLEDKVIYYLLGTDQFIFEVL